MKFHYESLNLDGLGNRDMRVYVLPIQDINDYWSSVTDVPCPIDSCDGIIRWYEAGYVPGYRICDKCKRHFMAKGSVKEPKLVNLNRKGTFS